MEEVKPCPFCGETAFVKRGDPEIKYVPFPDGEGGFFKEPAMSYEWCVVCPNCGASGLCFEDRIYREAESGDVVLHGDGKAKAIETWNRRAAE